MSTNTKRNKYLYMPDKRMKTYKQIKVCQVQYNKMTD